MSNTLLCGLRLECKDRTGIGCGRGCGPTRVRAGKRAECGRTARRTCERRRTHCAVPHLSAARAWSIAARRAVSPAKNYHAASSAQKLYVKQSEPEKTSSGAACRCASMRRACQTTGSITEQTHTGRPCAYLQTHGPQGLSADSCVARKCWHCRHGASVGASLRVREGCSPPRLSLVSQHD